MFAQAVVAGRNYLLLVAERHGEQVGKLLELLRRHLLRRLLARPEQRAATNARRGFNSDSDVASSLWVGEGGALAVVGGGNMPRSCRGGRSKAILPP